MLSISIEDKVSANLNKLADTLMNGIIKDGIHPYLDKVKFSAKRKHRFSSRTGKLERSITVKKNVSGGVVFLDRGLADYGKWVHNGTNKWAADKFLTDAAESKDRDLDNSIDQSMNKSIKKLGF